MPTGYTEKIAEGMSFEQYALLCARAFGACVEMRDEPLDAPIPDEFKPGSYYLEQIDPNKAQLTKAEAMTLDEAAAESRKFYEEQCARIRKLIDQKKALKAKYEAMLAKVRAWNPPTPEHNELKNFMERQITDSIDWDCDVAYYENTLAELEPDSAEKWKENAIRNAKESIANHEKKHREEVERARGRTERVRQLRQSLKQS